MDVLRGHVALGEHENPLAGGRVYSHIDYYNGMAGRSTLDENIANLQVVDAHFFKLLREGKRSGVGEDEVEVRSESIIGV